jgi:predicted phage replisome organizer
VVIPTAETNKRYYWLKLKDDFFRQKEIKQLRKIAGGDSYTIIYLKMLLRSLKDDGKLYYEGVDDDFVSELALDIDEDVENVKMTVAFLMAKGLLVQSQTDEYTLSAAESLTGSESYSAERVRRFREKQQLALHGNAAVTACNEEIEIEKEIEKRDRDRERVTRKRFTPPTVEEVSAYAQEKKYKDFSAERFVDFYTMKGWMVGKNRMQDWKAAVRGWAARDRGEAKPVKNNPALNYTQRDNSGYDDFEFFDPTKYKEGK